MLIGRYWFHFKAAKRFILYGRIDNLEFESLEISVTETYTEIIAVLRRAQKVCHCNWSLLTW